jgi:hypothetical protein
MNIQKILGLIVCTSERSSINNYSFEVGFYEVGFSEVGFLESGSLEVSSS